MPTDETDKVSRCRRALEPKSRDELTVIAKQLGLSGFSKGTKSDLIDLLLAANSTLLQNVLFPTLWARYHNHIYGAVTILGLILAVVFFIWSPGGGHSEDHAESPSSVSEEKPKIATQLSFKFDTREGKLIKGNPIIEITNTGLKPISPLIADADMFSFDSDFQKIATYAKLSFTTHGHLFFEANLDPGSTIRQEMPGIKNWNFTVLYHITVKMYKGGTKPSYPDEFFLIVDSSDHKTPYREATPEEVARLKPLLDGFISERIAGDK